MKEHVTVIPADQIIIVNGVALQCKFNAHVAGLHALQWHEGTGEIEIINDRKIRNVAIENYTCEVEPYVDIWQVNYDENNVSLRSPSEEKQVRYGEKEQIVMSEKVQERNNDSIASVCSYTVSTDPKFVAETEAGSAWRDTVCVRCYELMDVVRSADVRSLSQGEELLMLSVLKWVRQIAEGKATV